MYLINLYSICFLFILINSYYIFVILFLLQFNIKSIQCYGNIGIQYVDKIITKYDNVCTLSNALVVLHNGASQNVLAKSSGATDEGASDVKISELVRTVTENYGLYYQTREQVIGWQMWYSEQKKVFEGTR